MTIAYRCAVGQHEECDWLECECQCHSDEDELIVDNNNLYLTNGLQEKEGGTVEEV